MHLWSIILAAGQGKRLPEIKQKKQFLTWRDRPLYWHSARTFSHVPQIKGIVFVFPEEEREAEKKIISKLYSREDPGVEYRVVAGGRERRLSSLHGLQALPPECTHVLIHDAARPFVGARLINRVISALEQGAQGVVPGLAVTDTIKQTAGSKLLTLPRNTLYSIQTPQGFDKKTILEAHKKYMNQSIPITDDASLLEENGGEVQLVGGEPENRKITHSRDLLLLQEPKDLHFRSCIGWGYDVHRFAPGKPMKLGGIPIANGPEVLAHSDGDVLIHALIDAILGCLGHGDIGELYPDTDPALTDICSGILLREVLTTARKNCLTLDHLDLTIITQTPKIGPWKNQIKKNLVSLLEIEPERINLKATTEEKLGFTGRKEGIKAVAQVLGHFESNPDPT
ncbi:MAG: 2-C-methyl-D-erythritol 4-phosphate cytidylyltransferase [Desulfohalobiaceae bacterium]|nr:2-C-methyl-D-erythritol 4-phosphate cytidylyltransferase [Desulfohalobiaceae bacterium]